MRNDFSSPQRANFGGDWAHLYTRELDTRRRQFAEMRDGVAR